MQPWAPKLIQLPSSNAFTTENTEAIEKKMRSELLKSSSVLSVFSVVKSLAAKHFKNDGC
jgi:hypothetical protein